MFISQLLTSAVFVEGFLIRYRNLETGRYDVLSIHHSASGEYIVASLDKFTRYQFFLVPFYQSVLGRPSNVQEVRTSEDGKWVTTDWFRCMRHVVVIVEQLLMISKEPNVNIYGM